jgi:hypothetical protein
VIATSLAYHDHPPQRLLQNFPDTTRFSPASSWWCDYGRAIRWRPPTNVKSAGRLKPKQIVVAAMRKLLVRCFGVLKTGKRFDLAIAMPP